MDDADADAVLSLQLQDLDRLLETTADIKDQTKMPDGRVALVTYREELATRLAFIRDRRMGRSIARAVQQDGASLQEARRNENQAIRDRRTASRIGRIRNIAYAAPVIDLTDEADDVVMTGFAALNSVRQQGLGAEPGAAGPTRPRRSQRNAGADSRNRFNSQPAEPEPGLRPEPDRVRLFGVDKRCVSCNEEVPYFSAVYAPCGHDYCKDCAKIIFINSAREEALFPPRCCQQTIPLAAVDVYLTAEFIEHFKEKSVEFQTANRIYCPWPTCSAFIPPSRINGEIAVCEKCEYWVCTMCKGGTHQGRDCPEDRSLKDLVQTAKGAGWQRCYRCSRFVELSHGCNHIT